MTWQLIHLKNVIPTPWRNGGGTTRELLASPDPAAWQWRVSVAEVVQDGPFSSYAGVQRWFAVLEGDGVCLTVDSYMHMLTKSDQPLAFDGALDATCELLGGATQDFNLMLHGGTSARMLRVNGSFEMILNTPKIIAAYTHKIRAKVQIGSETYELLPYSFGWMHIDAHTTVHVQASDALLMEIDA
jgi:uncharacterized protein